jgi:cell division septal protein FtsQ
MGETDSIISKKRVFFLDGRNFFAINTQGIKQNLERKFVFQNLKIKTKFPQTLYVELEEREPSLLVSFVDSSSSASSSLKYYFLDKEGKIIREAAFNEGSGLIKVSIEKSDKPRVLGQQILLTANLPFLQFLKENLKIMGVDINQYLFSTGDDKVVNIQTGEGWKIVVDRQNDWKKQMQVLDTLLKNKIKDRKNLKYIDVRFENRSYYQ